MLTASVTSANTIKEGGYTVYEIKVSSTLSPLPWLVYKRYNEFDKLHQSLIKWNSRMAQSRRHSPKLPPLPPKKWWLKGADAIKSRQLKLEQYLTALLGDVFVTSDALLDFLAVPSALRKNITEAMKRQRKKSADQKNRQSKAGRLRRETDEVLSDESGKLRRRRGSTVIDESDRRLPPEEREINTLLRSLLIQSSPSLDSSTFPSGRSDSEPMSPALLGLGKISAMRKFDEWYLGRGGLYGKDGALTRQPKLKTELIKRVLCGTKDIAIVMDTPVSGGGSEKRRVSSTGLLGACSAVNDADNRVVRRVAMHLLYQLLNLERHRDAKHWCEVFVRLSKEWFYRLQLHKHLMDGSSLDVLSVLDLLVSRVPFLSQHLSSTTVGPGIGSARVKAARLGSAFGSPSYASLSRAEKKDVFLREVLHENDSCILQYYMWKHVRDVETFGTQMASKKSERMRRYGPRSFASVGSPAGSGGGSGIGGGVGSSADRLGMKHSSGADRRSRGMLGSREPTSRSASGSDSSRLRGTITSMSSLAAPKPYDCSNFSGYHEVSSAIHASFTYELLRDDWNSYNRCLEQVLTEYGFKDVLYKRHARHEWKLIVVFELEHSARDVYDFLKVGYVTRRRPRVSSGMDEFEETEKTDEDSSESAMDAGAVEGWNRNVIDWKPVYKLDEKHYIYEEIYKSFNSPYSFMSFTVLRCLKENDKEGRYRVVFASVSHFDAMVQQVLTSKSESGGGSSSLSSSSSAPPSSSSAATSKLKSQASGISVALTPTSSLGGSPAPPSASSSRLPGSKAPSERVMVDRSGRKSTQQSTVLSGTSAGPSTSSASSTAASSLVSSPPGLTRVDSGGSVSSTGSSGLFPMSSMFRQYDPLNTKKGTILPTGFEVSDLRDSAGNRIRDRARVTFAAHLTTESVLVVVTDLLGESKDFFLSLAGVADLVTLHKSQKHKDRGSSTSAREETSFSE